MGFWSTTGEILESFLTATGTYKSYYAKAQMERDEVQRQIARNTARNSASRADLPDSVRDEVLQRAAEIIAEREMRDRR